MAQIDINGHSLGIVAEALGGSNIGNCPHACVARPCGPLAECVPQMESYECRCSIYNERCNKAAEVPPEQLPELMLHKQQHNAQTLEAKQYKGVESKKMSAHKKHATKRKNLHKHKATTPATTTRTSPSTTRTTTTTPPTERAAAGAASNEEIEDDIIFRFMHDNAAQPAKPIGGQPPLLGKQHVSKHEHHQKPNAFARKLSRLPTHYESFQTNPDSDILTFDDNNDWVASLQQQEYADAMATSQVGTPLASSAEAAGNGDGYGDGDGDASGFVFDESLFDASDGAEDYQRKQLAQDMKRIMSNTHTHTTHTQKQGQEQQQQQQQAAPLPAETQYEDYGDDELLTPVLKSEPAVVGPSTPQTHTDWSLLKKFDLSAEHQSQVQSVRKNFGACFAGTDSYFHYNDADTMSQVISYNIDLNLRIKTHSENGVILWTGRQGTTELHDDYLSLGIEQG